MTSPASKAVDLRFCGICWADKDGVRRHYCARLLGHEGDHRCHCDEVLKRANG